MGVKSGSSSETRTSAQRVPRRGQEQSFQWIYVLIAGGAFLLLFFFLFKSCSASGDAEQSASSLYASAQSITSSAYNPVIEETNVTLTPAEVSCPANALTLTTNSRAQPLDNIPMFLPPVLYAKSTIVSRDMQKESQLSSILLGSVAYTLDEKTQYYLVVPSESELGVGASAAALSALALAQKTQGVIGDRPTMHRIGRDAAIGSDGTMTIARGASTAIVASFPARPAPRIIGAERVFYLNVSLNPPSGGGVATGVLPQVSFFERDSTDGTKWMYLGSAGYYGNELLLGAIISGKPDTYSCTKTTIIRRTGYITNVYQQRSAAFASQPSLSNACRTLHTNATTTLTTIHAPLGFGTEAGRDSYYKLLLSDYKLPQYQDAMFVSSGCPVIS